MKAIDEQELFSGKGRSFGFSEHEFMMQKLESSLLAVPSTPSIAIVRPASRLLQNLVAIARNPAWHLCCGLLNMTFCSTRSLDPLARKRISLRSLDDCWITVKEFSFAVTIAGIYAK